MKQFYQTMRKSIMVISFLLFTVIGFAAHFTTVWNGENGQNHMNFLVVSAILEDMPLGINDEVAVFSGSKCVGTTKLTKVINPSDNTTFFLISASQDDGTNNGFVDNDTIIFKIWDNQNQREMVAKSVTYRKDKSTWLATGKFSAGATSVVDLVSFVESTQTIQLIKGYNMISTYLTVSNPDICAVTKTLSNQGSLIKLQDEIGNSYEDWGISGGWINNVGNIASTEGYKIKVAANCSLQLTGRLIVLPLDIPLKAGWNIISFPSTENVNGLSFIQSLIDQNKLIKVQDETGNSIEDFGNYGGWNNSIGNFVPGKAYKVKVSSDAILTIQKNYPKSAIIQNKLEKTEYFKSAVLGNGVDHMNINIVGLKESGLSAGDELAAFDGNICVGSLKINENNLINGFAGLIASSSTDEANQAGFIGGHQIKIVSWNKLTYNESIVSTNVITGNMIFAKNGSVLVNLKLLATGIKDISESFQIDVFPNPCADKVNIRFSEIPEPGSKIDILDFSGRNVISRIIEGTSEVLNLAGLPSGLYLVKSTLGKTENVQKLIVN